MSARSSRVEVVIFSAALALGVTVLAPTTFARADESPPRVKAARQAPPPTAAANKPAPARVPKADARSLYACHPGEDLACTVIHQTAEGIVVVTFRPTGADDARVWSVVNASAETNANAGASSGGTIYIVPNGGRQLTAARASSNESPILE